MLALAGVVVADGVVVLIVSVLSCDGADEPSGASASTPLMPGAPAAVAPSSDLSWSPSTHVSVPSEFFAHTSSKWPIFAKKSVMPLVVSANHCVSRAKRDAKKRLVKLD